MSKMFHFCMLISIFFLSEASFAQSRFFDQNSRRIALGYKMFSGEQQKGLTQSTVGYGLDLSYRTANRLLGFVGGIDTAVYSGQEKIKDNSTVQTLNVSGESLGVYLGPLINIMPIRGSSMKPYLFASGIAHFYQLRVPSATYTKIKSSYSGYAGGFAVGGGLSWTKTTLGYSRGIFFEVKYQTLQVAAFEVSDYGVSGLQGVLGIEF